MRIHPHLRSICLAALLPLAAIATAAERAPNIIVIMADDLGVRDMALYDGWVKTPAIENMARQGMTLHNFHTNSSVCSPTRAALFTGRYQQRVDIVDVIVGSDPDRGLSASLPTLGKIFQQNGYATGLFGKWHLGHADEYNPVHHGFDEFIGLLNGAGDFHYNDRNWRKGLEHFVMEGYATDIITEDSVDFIERHQDEPFFLFVSHKTPHNPYQTRVETPDNRPEGWRQNRVSEENRPRYIQMLKDLDASVGVILDKVRATGLSENTLVFFLSDNGDVGMSPLVRKLRGTKFGHYQGGLRVPAVAWWPGTIPAGSQSHAFLLGFDLYPTFTEAAGIAEANPDNLDGKSFKTHLVDQAPVADRDIFFGYEPKLGTAMRRGPWKLIVKGDDLELYHLEQDPGETANVVADHPDVVAAMRAEVEQFKATVVPGS